MTFQVRRVDTKEVLHHAPSFTAAREYCRQELKTDEYAHSHTLGVRVAIRLELT